MRKYRFLSVLFLLILLIGCSAPDPSGDSEHSVIITPASSAEDQPPAAPVSSYVWVMEPVIDADSVYPLPDADHAGMYYSSPFVVFIDKGLCGLMNQAGEILLPAIYMDICWSQNQGGLLVLPEKSTAYQLLNTKYEVIGDAEIHVEPIADTPYVWSAARGMIVNGRTAESYNSEDFTAVRSGSFYALGNRDGLSTDFVYTAYGPTGLNHQFFVQDDWGWHLVSPSGDDLMPEVRLIPRIARTVLFTQNGTVAAQAEAAPYPCSEGIYVLQDDSGLWGYFDVGCSPITGFVFEDACPVMNSSAWACSDGKWGIVSFPDYQDLP